MSQVGIQLYDATGTPFVRLGEFPNGKIGLKISQSGVDVTKATPTQLVFNSDIIANSYTFPAIGSVVNGSPYTVTQPVLHGLGYVPAFQIYTQIPNLIPFLTGFPTVYYTQIIGLLNMADTSDPHISTTLAVGVDNQNLYFNRLTSNSDSGAAHNASPITLVYYIFEYGAVTF